MQLDGVGENVQDHQFLRALCHILHSILLDRLSDVIDSYELGTEPGYDPLDLGLPV